MRGLLLATALLWSGTVMAADLKTPSFPIKALTAGYPSGSCGTYYGFNVLGEGVTIPSSSVPGTTAIGGDIGGTFGYTCQYGNGGGAWFAEVQGDVQNLNGSTNGLALGGPWHFSERVGVSGPLLAFIPSLPNINLPAVPSLPALPNGITTQGPAMTYVYAGLNEDDISAIAGVAQAKEWLISGEVGIGNRQRVSNNVVVDVYAGGLIQSNALCVGVAICPKLGTGFRTGLQFLY